MMAPPKTLAAAAVRPSSKLRRMGFISAEQNTSSQHLVPRKSKTHASRDSMRPFKIRPSSLTPPAALARHPRSHGLAVVQSGARSQALPMNPTNDGRNAKFSLGVVGLSFRDVACDRDSSATDLIRTTANLPPRKTPGHPVDSSTRSITFLQSLRSLSFCLTSCLLCYTV